MCIGANPAALNSSNLTPFQVAISCGNTPVARHFISLYQNTKSTDPKYQSFCEGCHPSKAINGTTPLQLAFKSKNVDMIELLLNYATVHDVGRCWTQLEPGQHDTRLGNILLNKVRLSLVLSRHYTQKARQNGFTPSENESPHQKPSKTAAWKVKLAEKARKAHEEKERKLAQEKENQRANQARKEKAAKEEAERQEQREAERKRQLEDAEVEKMRLLAEQQKKTRKEVEERSRRDAEARELARQQEAANEAKRRLKEEEAATKQKAKEAMARQKDIEAAARRAKVEAEAIQIAQREVRFLTFIPSFFIFVTSASLFRLNYYAKSKRV